MRGAFVVVLRRSSHNLAVPMAGSMEGSVEEVDSGKEIHFRSEYELIGFLRERFAAIRSASTWEGGNGSNERGN